MYSFKEEYILDFSEVKYIYDVHQVIKKEFDFPDYYGANWDAFWDCLTDMYGESVNIEFIGIEKLRKAFGEEAENDIEILKRILYMLLCRKMIITMMKFKRNIYQKEDECCRGKLKHVIRK